jgi:type I site-specific restriction endonuclease
MQMIGRGTRPLPGVVESPLSSDARRAAIAASGKPECTVVDFCGNAGRHKLISMIDVLAGDAAEDLKAEMTAAAKADGQAVSIEELQQRVEAARERREQEAQHRRSMQGDGYRAERVEYTTDTHDMFGGDRDSRLQAVWEQRHGDITEKQYKLLSKLGVKPETAAGYSKRQAGNVIDAMTSGIGGDYRLAFGKYAGKTLLHVPRGYVQWLAGAGIGKASGHARMMLHGSEKSNNANEAAAF